MSYRIYVDNGEAKNPSHIYIECEIEPRLFPNVDLVGVDYDKVFLKVMQETFVYYKKADTDGYCDERSISMHEFAEDWQSELVPRDFLRDLLRNGITILSMEIIDETHMSREIDFDTVLCEEA